MKKYERPLEYYVALGETHRKEVAKFDSNGVELQRYSSGKEASLDIAEY